MASINFFQEDLTFKLKNKIKLREWIRRTIFSEGKKLDELNFIFCSDSYLLEINRQYLNHDTYTDIITFDNSDEEGIITGDIFISYERVCDNAKKFSATIDDELHRIIAHGTLHLLGYKDKSKADKALMTQKEDEYLRLREF
ncbi:rRNA maturation RNase YbeY [Desertivirga brevis]|uniref:rRNA maturation RNase YbeY n=1 Tax=Desertivirga brevis TaxID=2810310 RepID=UPI001A972DA6|nr:rRNA maturation RNase YbeY [Pedobacter sp. SYSU D00873]